MEATALPYRFERSWFNKHGEAQANDAEFEVYDKVCSSLDESWVVVPAHHLAELHASGMTGRTELDLLLFNQNYGIVIIEVKSYGSVAIRGGKLVRLGAQANEDPIAQAEKQRDLLAKAIKRILGDEGDHAWHRIAVALALPFVNPELVIDQSRLAAGWHQEQFLTPSKLSKAEISQSIHDVALLLNVRFSPEQMHRILQGLFPDQDLGFSSRGVGLMRQERARERVALVTKALESLDQNHRVYVNGSPGSGKSRLVVRWAQRAAARGERVLVTCHHRALATTLAERIGEHEGLVVAPLTDYLVGLPEVPIEPVDDSELSEAERRAYWPVATEAIAAAIDSIQARFDTVIADEVQDFDAWELNALERLAGEGRVLMVGDPYQHIQHVPRDPAEHTAGWTRASLPQNHRSPEPVAALLQRITEGSLSEADCEAFDPTKRILRFMDTTQEEGEPFDRPAEVDARVDQALVDYLERGVPAEGIVVLCTARADSDRIREAFHLRDWDHREGGGTLCDTVHKMKGGEHEAVILVSHRTESTAYLQSLLYSGAGRAASFLTVVGEDPALGWS